MIRDARLCRVTGDGLVRVAGSDARRFLHAQTTQRIDDLPPDATRPAAWLTAGGRVRAVFDVIPDREAFWLLVPAEMAASLAAGLRRYVLRDQVQIEQPADSCVLAVLGDVDAWLDQHGVRLATGAVAMVDGSSGGAGSSGGVGRFGADAVVLARTGPERVTLIVPAALEPRPEPGPATESAPVPAPTPELLTGLAPASAAAAELEAIACGRAAVTAALVERYIPQMLDLERLGAVSFNKGCYPGQEIVARTQNLGEVKRRLGRFRSPAGPTPAAGDAIVDSGGDDCGEVNRAAPTADGVELLAVVKRAADPKTLRLLSDGRALSPLALPWAE